jgi:hypothetical protein
MPFDPVRRASTLQWAMVLAAVLLAASAAGAAQVTDVANAFDERRPFEVDLAPSFSHQQRTTRISREIQGTDGSGRAATVLADELQSTETVDRLELRLGIGLYHDLELHLIAPVLMNGKQTWDYAAAGGTGSTLKGNTLNVSGCNGSGLCGAGSSGQKAIVAAPGLSQRGGMGDPTLGLAWSPINQEREARLQPEGFPAGQPVSTWVLGLDYTAPLFGALDDPSKYGLAAGGTSSSTSGSFHRKAHLLSPWTAFSKRFEVADPYLALRATLPFASGAYDNCSDTALLADVAPQNCALPAWKGSTGYQPSTSASFTLGTELVAGENTAAQRKFAFDLRGEATWFSPGRNYTQVADALGKLTYEQEHVQLLGTLAFYGRVARWLHFRLAGQLGCDTAHFLTSESIGKDLNGDGAVTISAGAAQKSSEQSPTFDFRLDQPGHRLHAELALLWGLSGTVSLDF